MCDSSHCYYPLNTDSTTEGKIGKVSINDGASASLVVPSGLNQPMSLNLTSSDVCWNASMQGISCAPKAMGPTRTVVTATTFALNTQNGFVNDGQDFFIFNSNAQIYSVPVTQINGTDSDITTVVSNLNTPWGGILQGTTLYFIHTQVNGQFTKISRVSKTGGAVTEIATAQTGNQIWRLATDGMTLCWSEMIEGQSTGLARCMPAAGGEATTVASGMRDPISINVSGNFAYVGVRGLVDNLGGGGSLQKCAINGGGCTTLVSNTSVDLWGLPIVGDEIFFVNRTSGGTISIKKVAK